MYWTAFCSLLCIVCIVGVRLENRTRTARQRPTPLAQVHIAYHTGTVKGVPGEQSLLLCEVFGQPPPLVKWYRGEQYDIDNYAKQMYSSPFSAIARVVAAQPINEFTNSASDQDLYTCAAKSLTNVKTAVTRVGRNEHAIRSRPTPSSNVINELRIQIGFENYYVSVLVPIGSRIELPCRHYGRARVVTNWFDPHDHPIDESRQRYTVTEHFDLIIQNVEPRDTGYFKCVISATGQIAMRTTFVLPFYNFNHHNTNGTGYTTTHRHRQNQHKKTSRPPSRRPQ